MFPLYCSVENNYNIELFLHSDLRLVLYIYYICYILYIYTEKNKPTYLLYLRN